MLTPDAVVSRLDLVAFIEGMSREASEWPNNELDVFLEALSAWIGDMDGWFHNRGEHVPSQPDWRLTAATVYE